MKKLTDKIITKVISELKEHQIAIKAGAKLPFNLNGGLCLYLSRLYNVEYDFKRYIKYSDEISIYFHGGRNCYIGGCDIEGFYSKKSNYNKNDIIEAIQLRIDVLSEIQVNKFY